MHFQHLFVVSILSFMSIAAANAREAWTDVALKSSSNVVRLNDQNFDQLVAHDRNYTSISKLAFSSRT
jgi:hypothetical protein